MPSLMTSLMTAYHLSKAARINRVDPVCAKCGDFGFYETRWLGTSPEGLGRRADDILISEEERKALIGMFEGDDEAQLILEGRLGGMEGDELRKFVGLNETQYKSKLRKIRRAINKAYTAGKDRK